MKKCSITKSICITFFLFFSIHHLVELTPVIQAIEMNEQIAVQTKIVPEKLTYNENAVITINVPNEMNVEEITIDASEIGGPKNLNVDTKLMEQTISVMDSTTAGIKSIVIQAKDVDGKTHTESVQLEIEPRHVSNDFDWDEAIIYFLLTDRFKDGDPFNNDPNEENYDARHPETYHGGDFQGVINQLDYLSDLGINTIWITPIVDNVNHNHRYGKKGSQYGYHGYWAKDFTKIDEHLGDIETFKTLIDEAHNRGIKIMVDVVLNHTGYGMKVNVSGKNIPNFPTNDEQAMFQGMLRENPLNGHDILGEIYGLPDFKTEESNVRNQIIQWQVDWLERARTERGDTIDYFRVDTIKHIEDTTWNAFKNELTKIKPDFKIMGESWGATYNQTSNYLQTGRMDSLLDFDFKRIASMFTHGKIEQAEMELIKRNEAINNTAMLGHFLSSHDEDGFLYYFMQGDEDLFKVAISLQMTAKGQPIIYYGEEIGLSGKAEGNMEQGEFSDNRTDFNWDLVEENHLVDHYQKLLATRQKHSKVFAKGNRQHISGSNEEKYSVFSRNYNEETIIVAINTSTEAKKANFQSNYEPGVEVLDEYNNVIYPVLKDQSIDINIPSYENGGTVILSISKESSWSDQNDTFFLIIGLIITVTIIVVIFWIRKYRVQV